MDRVLNGALQVLYRGPLSSCNYTCGYCPFHKRKDHRAELAQDQNALERFVNWAISYTQTQPLAILFTPWGEALVRRYYQQALIALSHLPNLRRVAIQTNLSASLTWLNQADPAKIALWCTYHPSQTTLKKFLAQCQWLQQHNLRFSVGMVGNRAELPQALALRQHLPSEIYLWINANRAEQPHYTATELAQWQTIDPLFAINLSQYASLGQRCYAGTRSISVNGDGTVQRCHFVKKPLGNLYQAAGFVPETAPCPNTICDCHIGYIQLPILQQYAVYGDGLLERIPQR